MMLTQPLHRYASSERNSVAQGGREAILLASCAGLRRATSGAGLHTRPSPGVKVQHGRMLR